MAELTAQIKAFGEQRSFTKKDQTVVPTVQVVFDLPNQKFPKSLAITFQGEDATRALKSPIGTELKVQYDVESREWNGKYFTEAKAWKVESAAKTASAMQPNQQFNATGGQPSTDNQGNALNDATADLPFLRNQSVTHD